MYTRVFESILDSSINVQRIPPSARWLWITMLLIADKNRTGVVDMPVERLAARAGLSVEQTREGLAILSAPDAESTTPDEDGRRIVPIRDDSSRGWKLVNWEKYKAIANEDQQREATRRRVADWRAKRRDVTDGNEPDVTCNPSEAEAPPETKQERVTRAPAKPDFEAAARIYGKLKQSALKEIPPEQVAVGLVTEFGEELILETLVDCENEYTGKGWRYLERILIDRRDHPDKRPAQRRARRSDGNGRDDKPDASGGAAGGRKRPVNYA